MTDDIYLEVESIPIRVTFEYYSPEKATHYEPPIDECVEILDIYLIDKDENEHSMIDVFFAMCRLARNDRDQEIEVALEDLVLEAIHTRQEGDLEP